MGNIGAFDSFSITYSKFYVIESEAPRLPILHMNTIFHTEEYLTNSYFNLGGTVEQNTPPKITELKIRALLKLPETS